MKIARQGRRFIAAGWGVALLGTFIMNHHRGLYHSPLSLDPFGMLLAVLGAGFSTFCSYFFRDPDRPLPADTRKIYSPGDGRVLSIAREGPGDITTIRIFLSIFDVHVQRIPFSGRVDQVQYQKGSFKMAMRADAKLNERNWVRIVPEGGRSPLVVEQIAGYIARRIECWVKAGDQVGAGSRYGIIYFGSQVAVHLPKEAKILLKPGDRAVGSVTAIAEWID